MRGWSFFSSVLGTTLLFAAGGVTAPSSNDASPTTTGSLSFEIRDQATGKPMAGRLTLVRTDGAQRPWLATGEVGRLEGTALVSRNQVFSLGGIGEVTVPAGTYDISVSRGPEWTATQLRAVTVTPLGTKISATLSHVIDTPGWISADLHVHAAPSFDSEVPERDRVYEYVTSGVEVLVSADHNAITDYGPWLDELGQREQLVGLSGDEVTSKTWGHFSAFPLPYQPTRPRGGAIATKQRRPGQLRAALRRRNPSVFLQANHPRLSPSIGYFYRGGFDSEKDTALREGFLFDLDGIELLNGCQSRERAGMERALVDFHNMLRHGHLWTATGNSDTHRLSSGVSGYPRNYVFVGDDRPATLSAETLVGALRAHCSFFTTGPFVTLRVGNAMLGDVADVVGRRVPVDITVEAAPWVSVSQVALYLGDAVARRWQLRQSQNTVRLREHVDLAVAEDNYLIVRVDGDVPLYPVVGDAAAFAVYPLAFTNPIFLDANHNGRFDPSAATPSSPANTPDPADPVEEWEAPSPADDAPPEVPLPLLSPAGFPSIPMPHR